MKSPAAMLIGILVATLGIIGMVAPQTYVQLGWFWETPTGLYLFAAVQVVVGLVLIRAAPRSRSPLGLGALGVLALIEAVFMPLLGHGRAHAVAHWWSSQSASFLRLWGLLELVVGVLIICAVAPGPRELRTAPST